MSKELSMIPTYHRADATAEAQERRLFPRPGWPLAINERREDRRPKEAPAKLRAVK